MILRKTFAALALSALGGLTMTPSARATYLYWDGGTSPSDTTGYIVPSFAGEPDSQYSAWDIMYSPYNGANYPDIAAPFGIKETASAAGFTPPSNSSPSNPTAYWNTGNPTITQIGTNTAFIIGPGTQGDIYSFAAPTAYTLADTTPYNLGTILFQFENVGSLVNLSSIVLTYTNTSGQTISLSPEQYLTEYQGTTVPGQGFSADNRIAVEWDLSGLGITSYQIGWSSSSPSTGFENASLDTSVTSADAIPVASTWTASGTGAWSTAGNWSDGTGFTSANENGNLNFANSAAATAILDADHAVGQVNFNTAANTTISSPGGNTLTVNSGVNTGSTATGTYTISSNVQLGDYGLFDIEAGKAIISGSLSTEAGLSPGTQGFLKTGNGELVLSNNNSFYGSVGIEGGTLWMSGTNSYSGGTSIIYGTLEVAADALSGTPGALGNSTATIALGADSSLYANLPAASATAQIIIDGDHTIGLAISLAGGTFQKVLGAKNTTSGAVYSGAIALNAASNVTLSTASSSDRVTFSGGINGGVASTGSLTISGPGTVIYSGSAAFSYANNTNVSAGTLLIDAGASFTGSGSMMVASDAKLAVNGTLSGSGGLALNGTLSGSGTVNRAFTVAGGASVSPGSSTNSIGSLNTVSESWGGGGSYIWSISSLSGAPGTGWDTLNITGSLAITANLATPFVLSLTTLLADGVTGSLAGFNPATNYSWTIATASLGITGFSTSDFTVDSSGFSGATGQFSVAQSGNSLVLNYVAVPEPATYALLALGGIIVYYCGRRRASANS